MAREYETVEIDEVTYELHKVKVDNKPIGSVPVRQFAGTGEFIEFVNQTAEDNVTDVELIVTDYKYGLAVRLQGKARKRVSVDKYNSDDHNRIFNELSVADPDWLAGYVGKGDALDKACKAEFDRQVAENPIEVDGSKVWSEVL